jgi:hypothetical protein
MPPSLLLPAFLHGPLDAIRRKTRAEGRRGGEHYRKNGSIPAPRASLEVPAGELVVAHEVVDFERERPAWRLYMVSNVLGGLYEAMDWQEAFQVRDAYEASCRETAWGALYFAISRTAPMSAERTALRLQAVLRFWDSLQSARYLFKTLDSPLTLEELMSTACDWAMDAWCPVGEDSVRVRLEVAAERMARATKEDSLEAILRQVPHTLTFARDLKHRALLADPALLRERFAVLDPESFERVSGACTSELLGQLYAWDRQLGTQ